MPAVSTPSGDYFGLRNSQIASIVPPELRAAGSATRPKLLVSVRSRAEAEEALRGGADIIDLKDPAKGSLGCAGREVMETLDGLTGPVTAALGECGEWRPGTSFAIPAGISLLKLGLAGMAIEPDWEQRWLTVRRSFEEQAHRSLQWAAVAYVDAQVSRAPAVATVADQAIATGCAGLLLDTFEKRSGRLFDHVTEQELADLGDRMHSAGMFLAAAGRLTIADITRLVPLAVDIVAVRSAACAGDDRQNAICAWRVAECRVVLDSAVPRSISHAC